MNRQTTLFLLFLLTVSLACKTLTAPMATATPPQPTLGCAVVASGGADFPGALTLPETQIGGYGWVNA